MLKIYDCEEIAVFRGEPWKDSIQKAHKAAQETYRKRREKRSK